MMKRYIILIFVVALMSSCNGDRYDNINEYVDSEIVYPAGYDQADVVLKAGFERIVINLMKDIDKEPKLTKAKKTVVEYGDMSQTFTPARSWVNITGLTIPQTYNFNIFTEDEFGNRSAPVEVKGRPFTEADRSAWIVSGATYLSSASYAYIRPSLSPAVYDIVSIDYNFNDGSVDHTGTQTGNVLCVENLPSSQTVHVNLTYHILPIGALDEVLMPGELEIATTSQADFDAYLYKGTPFGLRDINITKDAPYVISAADFDLGGYNVSYWRGNDNYGNGDGANDINYRATGGDDVKNFGVHTASYSAGLHGLAWTSNGAWYEYTVNVVDPGVYRMEFNNARQREIGRAHV
jgi:hypothetical protein